MFSPMQQPPLSVSPPTLEPPALGILGEVPAQGEIRIKPFLVSFFTIQLSFFIRHESDGKALFLTPTTQEHRR